MFDVFTNLRNAKASTKSAKATTTVNIHRSGWTMKLQGDPAQLTDEGTEQLFLAQPCETVDGALIPNVKLSGKVDTESHKQAVQYTGLSQDHILATLRGEEVDAPQDAKAKEAAKAAAAKAKADAKAAAEAAKAARNGTHATADSK